MNVHLQILLWVPLTFFVIMLLRRLFKKKSRIMISDGQISGFLLWQWADRIVDYVVYPTVIVYFGMWKGGAIMIVFTLIGNMIYIHVNNNTDEDWTFMKWLIELRDLRSFLWINHYDHLLKKAIHLPSRILRRCAICWFAFLRQLLRVRIGRFKLSNTITFLALSTLKDSFTTMNYLFHKRVDLMNPKVMTLFLVSHVICNVAWLPIASLIGLLEGNLFRFFSVRF
jgi:hypothetical protein